MIRLINKLPFFIAVLVWNDFLTFYLLIHDQLLLITYLVVESPIDLLYCFCLFVKSAI
jgi:hypothetical protein